MTEEDLRAAPTVAMPEAASPLEDSGAAFGVTVIEVLAEFASRKRLIAAVTGAAMLVGLVYGLALPARYSRSRRHGDRGCRFHRF
jgi:hypothetical protein